MKDQPMPEATKELLQTASTSFASDEKTDCHEPDVTIYHDDVDLQKKKASHERSFEMELGSRPDVTQIRHLIFHGGIVLGLLLIFETLAYRSLSKLGMYVGIHRLILEVDGLGVTKLLAASTATNLSSSLVSSNIQQLLQRD
ncbi:hypothetical protein GH714_008442 [Hevea brasiliensis]|uniref:Uncharacterized protein n=1 Tax=Hevea brasiliensis TaxID=3981 RepID=A0A6A6MXK4_HEVBR|nr:hypothetical protein GH714_008442 [Hevea brasiliensis]